MTQEFKMRPEVDNEETFVYYDGKGGLTDSKDNAALYEYSCNGQSKFFVRTFDGQLYNPLEAIPARHARETFHKVGSDVFNSYLQYLKNPGKGAFTAINRKVMYNL